MITIDGGTGKIIHNGINVTPAPMVDNWYVNAQLQPGSGTNTITDNW